MSIESNTEELNIFFKQQNLFDPVSTQPTFHVYGAGSIGSHVVYGLAKTGFTNIEVYDFDTVESSNIPAQHYVLADSGIKKIDALAAHIRHAIGTTITTHDVFFTPENVQSHVSRALNSIHIIAFDNIEARKLIAESLYGYPVILIDGRIGGFSYTIYNIDCSKPGQMNRYKVTLEGLFSEQLCGEKCLWGVNALISSHILGNIFLILRQKEYPFVINGNFLAKQLIVGEQQ